VYVQFALHKKANLKQWKMFRLPKGLGCPEIEVGEPTELSDPNEFDLVVKTNVEINTFVLKRIYWIPRKHPNSARMDDVERVIAEEDDPIPEENNSSDFDPFGMNSPLSCKTMYLTRPPVEFLAFPLDHAEEDYEWSPPSICSKNGITIWDMMLQIPDETRRYWTFDIRKSLFGLEAHATVSMIWDYAAYHRISDLSLDEAIEEFDVDIERYPQEKPLAINLRVREIEWVKRSPWVWPNDF
jgi:hypothetical protein